MECEKIKKEVKAYVEDVKKRQMEMTKESEEIRKLI